MVVAIAELWMVESTPLADRERIQQHLPEHLDYQNDLEARQVLFGAGPVRTPAGQPTGRGLIILKVASEEDARAIADHDPMHKHGLRSYQLSKWSLNEGIVRALFAKS